jgi:hypothetical protein
MFWFILAAFGLTQILVYGGIFDPIRPKYKFFHCTMCVGFWVGAMLFGLSPYVTLFSFDYNVATGFVLSCVASGTSYILDKLFSDNGLKIFLEVEK